MSVFRPHAHGPIEEQVLGAGTALFVEKPLALDLPTAERIADTARKAGVVTAVGHHWRYSPAVDLVRELLDGRPVRLAVGSWIDRVPPVPWWSTRALSGGQIVEQAVHVLDLIRLLCGDVVEVNAYANAAPPGTPDADVDGATVAILKLQSGAVGTVAAACCVDWKHLAGLELHADGLSVTIHEDGIIARTAQGPVQRSLQPDDAKRAADRAFIDAVVGNGAARGGILVDYEEALADPPIGLRHSGFGYGQPPCEARWLTAASPSWSSAAALSHYVMNHYRSLSATANSTSRPCSVGYRPGQTSAG